MHILGRKLGPIIFRFPFFSRSIFPDRHVFTDGLGPFLEKPPADHKCGIEIRNRDWLNAEFADLLRITRSLLCFRIDLGCQTRWNSSFDPFTAGWT